MADGLLCSSLVIYIYFLTWKSQALVGDYVWLDSARFPVAVFLLVGSKGFLQAIIRVGVEEEWNTLFLPLHEKKN